MGKFRFLSMALLAFCFGFIICSAVPSLNAEESKRALTIDDLFKLKTVGDPQVSPEGMWVAYTITEVDPEKDKSETRVWMASVGHLSVKISIKGILPGSTSLLRVSNWKGKTKPTAHK